MGKIKEVVRSPYMIFVLIAVKLGVYYSLIDADIFQSPMALLTTAVMAGLFLGLAQSGGKRKKGLFLFFYSAVGLVMFMDSMYYNYYNQTASVKQIWQVSNVAAVPNSFIATLIPASFLFFLDIPLAFYYFKRQVGVAKQKVKKIPFRYIGCPIALLVIFCTFNPLQSVMVSKINSVEFFTNHFKDIFGTLLEKVNAEEIPADQILKNVDEMTEENSHKKFEGIAKGKNLIVIQMESIQNFLIHRNYNGQEITPNLNKLIKNQSFYFDHYFTSIGKGNTVDAEFATLNSLYPVIDREAYTLYQDNTFDGLPWLLRDEGYKALAIHGYKGEFWNRSNAYPNQGFQEFYSQEKLKSDDIIGLGISDKSMFRQAGEILEKQKEPFFSFIITLTSHHPYLIDEKDANLVLKEEDKDSKFGAYLQTVHYMDEAIGEFIEDLKVKGLYDNTVIALYGDHHGLNWKMDDNYEKMTAFLGREYNYDEMLRIPLIVHVPGMKESKEIHTAGGQIDFLPTISNIMGINIKQPYVLGQDLLNAKEGFAAFTAYMFEGSFIKDGAIFQISREGVFDGSKAWDPDTGEEVDASGLKKEYNKAVTVKNTSKAILNQNLIAHFVKH